MINVSRSLASAAGLVAGAPAFSAPCRMPPLVWLGGARRVGAFQSSRTWRHSKTAKAAASCFASGRAKALAAGTIFTRCIPTSHATRLPHRRRPRFHRRCRRCRRHRPYPAPCHCRRRRWLRPLRRPHRHPRCCHQFHPAHRHRHLRRLLRPLRRPHRHPRWCHQLHPAHRHCHLRRWLRPLLHHQPVHPSRRAA